MSASVLPSSWLASGLFHASALGWFVLVSPATRPSTPPEPQRIELRMDLPSPAPRATERPMDPSPTHEVVPPSKERAQAPRAQASRALDQAKASAHEKESAPPDTPLDLTGSMVTEQGVVATISGAGGHGLGALGSGHPPSPIAPMTAPTHPTFTPREALSRPPVPPDLSARLLASYPTRAKAMGESGQATLTLVILADGRVESIELRSASTPDFGRACVDTVRGSRWQSPLDKDARPTSTRVGYTCIFDVR